ncbi:MAG: nitroreductase family protein [bacterium]
MASEEYWKKRPDMIDLIMERRSIRKYTDQLISDEDIEKILLAGQHAPNASNMQTWKFIAVTNREFNHKLSQIVDTKFREIGNLFEDREVRKSVKMARFYAAFFKDAPLVVYCVATKYISKSDTFYEMLGDEGSVYRENRIKSNPGLQSVSAAIENMLLAAWALGIGGVWMTEPIVARQEIEDALEIKDGELTAIVPFGYSSTPLRKPVRKPLDEVVRYIK